VILVISIWTTTSWVPLKKTWTLMNNTNSMMSTNSENSTTLISVIVFKLTTTKMMRSCMMKLTWTLVMGQVEKIWWIARKDLINKYYNWKRDGRAINKIRMSFTFTTIIIIPTSIIIMNLKLIWMFSRIIKDRMDKTMNLTRATSNLVKNLILKKLSSNIGMLKRQWNSIENKILISFSKKDYWSKNVEIDKINLNGLNKFKF
jgi:hypothetical protein